MHACPPYELGMEFAVVVEGDGTTNDKSIWEGQISARVADDTEILLSLTTVENVMVSINEDWCHWAGEVSAGRVKGRTIKWTSKSRGREQLRIQWGTKPGGTRKNGCQLLRISTIHSSDTTLREFECRNVPEVYPQCELSENKI
jgi:hypothetical protein